MPTFFVCDFPTWYTHTHTIYIYIYIYILTYIHKSYNVTYMYVWLIRIYLRSSTMQRWSTWKPSGPTETCQTCTRNRSALMTWHVQRNQNRIATRTATWKPPRGAFFFKFFLPLALCCVAYFRCVCVDAYDSNVACWNVGVLTWLEKVWWCRMSFSLTRTFATLTSTTPTCLTPKVLRRAKGL